METNKRKILIIAAPGFEETELVAPFDLWTRFGYQCDILSLNNQNLIKSKGGIILKTDHFFDHFLKDIPNQIKTYDVIFLPGGPGFQEYLKSPQLKNLIKEFINMNKIVAAICAAPMVLDEWRIIENKKISVFPGFRENIQNNHVQNQRATIDGNLVTGQNPAAVFDFGLKVIEALDGKEKTDSFRKQMTL